MPVAMQAAWYILINNYNQPCLTVCSADPEYPSTSDTMPPDLTSYYSGNVLITHKNYLGDILDVRESIRERTT